MFMTALQFIPVNICDVTIAYQAQQSSAYTVEGRNPIKEIKAFVPIAFPIASIAVEKTDSLELFKGLGHRSGKRTHLPKLLITSIDRFFLISMILVLSLTIRMRPRGMSRIPV